MSSILIIGSRTDYTGVGYSYTFHYSF